MDSFSSLNYFCETIYSLGCLITFYHVSTCYGHKQRDTDLTFLSIGLSIKNNIGRIVVRSLGKCQENIRAFHNAWRVVTLVIIYFG